MTATNLSRCGPHSPLSVPLPTPPLSGSDAAQDRVDRPPSALDRMIGDRNFYGRTGEGSPPCAQWNPGWSTAAMIAAAPLTIEHSASGTDLWPPMPDNGKAFRSGNRRSRRLRSPTPRGGRKRPFVMRVLAFCFASTAGFLSRMLDASASRNRHLL
jgi:hypothetical protein